MKQQRIFEITLIYLIIKQLEGKSINTENQRVKRGSSKYGENEYGTEIHVSSGVLQYGNARESGSLDIGTHYETSSINEDPWKASGLSTGYEVWLEPSSSYHPSSASPEIHTSSIHTSAHPGSEYITNSIFSDDSIHSAHLPVSQLHTQIIGSSSGSSHDIDDHHSISTISDNIDFSNVADINSKHYVKSYGK